MVGMSDLDDNVVQQILSRLPSEFLGRSMSVCRKWKDLISEPSFKSTHYRRHPRKVAGFIAASKIGGKLSYIPLDDTDTPKMSLSLGRRDYFLKASCNGLILCSPRNGKLFLYDPGTGARRQLPVCSGGDLLYGLAVYVSKVKVVALTKICLDQFTGLGDDAIPKEEELYQFRVLDGDAWRVSTPDTHQCSDLKINIESSSVFHEGALHWLGWDGIIAFDVGEEKSYVIRLPEELKIELIARYPNVWFGVTRGRLSLMKYEEEHIIVWGLGDNGRWEMEKTKTLGFGYQARAIPLLYDEDKCVLLTWTTGLRAVVVYSLQKRKWDAVRPLRKWMDGCLHILPYNGPT